MEMTTYQKFTKRISPCQTTAFTSIFMGVFQSSILLNQITTFNVTEEDVYRQYGQKLLDALQIFSEYSTLEQVYVIHRLQR